MEPKNTKVFPKALRNCCWNTRKESTTHSCLRGSGLALWTKRSLSTHYTNSICYARQQSISYFSVPAI